jgi:hypothetical protein
MTRVKVGGRLIIIGITWPSRRRHTDRVRGDGHLDTDRDAEFDAETGRLTGSPSRLTTSRDQINFFDLSADGRAALFELRRGAASSIWRADANRTLEQPTSARTDNSSARSSGPDLEPMTKEASSGRVFFPEHS